MPGYYCLIPSELGRRRLLDAGDQVCPFAKTGFGIYPAVLADALEDAVNLAIWERCLSASVEAFVSCLLETSSHLAESLALELPSEDAEPDLQGLAAGYRHIEGHADFVADVGWLAQAYSCLLGARRIGLRLRILDRTMCPRFHVDYVPLRLITTYVGAGSQWLEEGAMCRSQLGNPAEEPGSERVIHQLECGHVALFKGEKWSGNEGKGLIHRSPQMEVGEKRLVLTMDWLG